MARELVDSHRGSGERHSLQNDLVNAARKVRIARAVGTPSDIERGWHRRMVVKANQPIRCSTCNAVHERNKIIC